MPDYYALILYPLGVLFTLGAVALGGFLVFKTRRDPEDRLFGREPKGEAFNVEEPWEAGKGSPEAEETETPPATAAAALNFREQLADDKVPVPKIAKEMEEKE